MRHDITNPTTLPYGFFKLYQASPFDDVHIDGEMWQMPPPASSHGFHINYKPYPGTSGDNNCHDTTVPRWDEQATPVHTGPAGLMNALPSQVGNLAPVEDDSAGYASYNVQAWRPTMFGPLNMTILKHAMVIYMNEDDITGISKYSYYYGDNVRSIACCNIIPFHVKTMDDDFSGKRDLECLEEGTEILTPEEYKEIFGIEYDPADWELEAFIN